MERECSSDPTHEDPSANQVLDPGDHNAEEFDAYYSAFTAPAHDPLDTHRIGDTGTETAEASWLST